MGGSLTYHVAMRASRYQQYLGLPPEIVSPDSYQLLGIQRGFIDPTTIETTIHERMQHLEKADDAGAAAFLRLELEEAKATLMDPVRREAYDELLERQRLGELKRLVPAMLEKGILPAASEKAIREHVAATGVDDHKIAGAIADRLRESGATRGSHDTPSAEAMRTAIAQMRIALRALADQQLEAAMRKAGIDVRPSTHGDAPVPEPAPEPEPPAPEPAPTRRPKTGAQPAVKKETARRAPPAEPEPPALEESPEARVAMQMTELNERIVALEKTKARQAQTILNMDPELERMARKLRRFVRSLGSALAMSLAFIAGHLARLIPGVGAKIDEITASNRESMIEAQSSMTTGLTGGAIALALYGFIVIASGFKKKAWFLVPAIVLAVAAAAAGAALMR